MRIILQLAFLALINLLVNGFTTVGEQEFRRNFGRIQKKSDNKKIEGVDQEYYEKLKIQELPQTFEWWDVDGQNYLTIIRNQHIPQYCGSCWAFAATSALSDRIKIMRNNAFPDIYISPQVILTCAQEKENMEGCDGGDTFYVYKWIYENQITDETCSIYTAQGWTDKKDPQICTGETKCKNCDKENGCFVPKAPKIYGIESYGSVSGEEDMMNEIMKNGPIACDIAVTLGFLEYKEGIYIDNSGRVESDHCVSIVGWGEENGVKYWLGRNSWGSYWGMLGMFKIIRGVNNLGIEDNCSWAIPKDTWTLDIRNNTQIAEEIKESSIHLEKELQDLDQEIQSNQYKEPKMSLKAGCDMKDSKKTFKDLLIDENYLDREIINIKAEDLPEKLDWRDKDNKNYMSWTVNQHIPEYCGSCWAQAALSAVADRINILRDNQFPNLALAPQVLINCNQGGNCDGGYSLDAYISLVHEGVPEVTCQQYVAKNPEEFSCSAIQNCQNCEPFPVGCWGQKEYPRWFISGYGSISGAENMKKQILKNGPITCRIAATILFDSYEGDSIFSQYLENPTKKLNHAISVVGWGVNEEGIEYWIGRNSWGTYWGDYGYFYMQMYEDNLGIEHDCSYAIPKLTY